MVRFAADWNVFYISYTGDDDTFCVACLGDSEFKRTGKQSAIPVMTGNGASWIISIWRKRFSLLSWYSISNDSKSVLKQGKNYFTPRPPPPPPPASSPPSSNFCFTDSRSPSTARTDFIIINLIIIMTLSARKKIFLLGGVRDWVNVQCPN